MDNFNATRWVGAMFLEVILVGLLISNGFAGYHAFNECSQGNEFNGFQENTTRLQKFVGYMIGYPGIKVGCWLGTKPEE